MLRVSLPLQSFAQVLVVEVRDELPVGVARREGLVHRDPLCQGRTTCEHRSEEIETPLSVTQSN